MVKGSKWPVLRKYDGIFFRPVANIYKTKKEVDSAVERFKKLGHKYRVIETRNGYNLWVSTRKFR